MKDPKTSAYIHRKDKGQERFDFPPLKSLFYRGKEKKIKEIKYYNTFKEGCGLNFEGVSNFIGSLIQEVICEDGEKFQRLIQCRLDDSKHNGAPLHLNIDIITKSNLLKKDITNHKEQIKFHYSDFDTSKFEGVRLGFITSGKQIIQPILFPHNKKAIEYWKKTEYLLKNRNSLCDNKIQEISNEIMTLYNEMNNL